MYKSIKIIICFCLVEIKVLKKNLLRIAMQGSYLVIKINLFVRQKLYSFTELFNKNTFLKNSRYIKHGMMLPVLIVISIFEEVVFDFLLGLLSEKWYFRKTSWNLYSSSKVNEMKKSEAKFSCFKQVNFDRSKNCEMEKSNYENFTFRFWNFHFEA